MIKKILISQPAPAASKSPYDELKDKHSLDVVFHPFIKVVPVTEREFRDQRVGILDHTAVVFTSRHAIDNFFRLCKEMRIKVPEDMKYFGISENIILYIQKYVQYRKRKVFFSPTGKAAGLLPSMLKHKTERFLIPQGNIHADELTQIMDTKGLKHTECVMYHTVSNDFTDGTTLSDFDAVVLFTPSGVRSLVQNFPDWEQGDTRLICFGDTTVAAVSDTNLRLDYAPNKDNTPSIAGAIDAYLTEQNK